MTAPNRAGPQQKQQQRRDDDHSEWAHGPVAAAINASLVAALLSVVIRLTHLPAGLGLFAGVVLAVVLVAAGRMRRPRPLAFRSLMYRGTAMFTAGMWLWVQTADFSQVHTGAVTGLILAAVGLAGAAGMIAFARSGHGVMALVAAGVGVAGALSGVFVMTMANVLHVFTTSAALHKTTYLPWLWHGVVSLVIIAAVFAILGAVCANHEAELDDVLQRALLMKSHGREMVAMQELLRTEQRAPNLKVEQYHRWDNGAGEDYKINGVVDGVTPDAINRNKDTLAAKLDLPNGCGIEAVQGLTRGSIIVAVSRINKIKDNHVYPSGYKKRSIYNGLPIGVLRDGTEVCVRLRESSAFVFGQKRSGKTTVLYDLAAGICQCTDALLWVIDLGGGGVALPYLYPFAEGRCDIPAVDWVATTVEEAKKMAQLALAIALDRKTFYKHRKRKANTNLLPLDAELPEIIIMIDEGRQIMGESPSMSYEAKEVRGILEDVVATAGDSGVNVIFSGLNATQGVIDRETLSHLAIRVGMRVTEGRELAYGFDQDYGLNPADIPYQGSGFVKASHEESTRVFKAFLIEPEQMDEIAVATEGWRPALDPRGQELGGAVYAERWSRTTDLLTDENGNLLIDVANIGTATAVMDRPGADDGAAPQGPKPPAPRTGGPTPPDPFRPGRNDDVNVDEGRRPPQIDGSVEDLLREADQVADRLTAAAHAASGGSGDDLDQTAVDDRFAQAMRAEFDWSDPNSWPELPMSSTAAAAAQAATAPAPKDDAPAGDQHGSAVLERLVRHHGPDGIQAKDIMDSLERGGPWGAPVEVTSQTVHGWLAPGKNPDGSRRPAAWLADRRPRAPYVHRDFQQPGSSV